ncbi:MAG: histidine phosphatase family protein [Caulobacteraceae bacterium]|nr:histidine phosphatase family protein [Caulobacteraceae bacterium]
MRAPGGVVTLVRHGEPALSRKMRLSSAGYRQWWATYEDGGLKPGQSPPPELIRMASAADTVFCSTRPRAIESARAITAGGEFQPDIIFVEAPLPPPPLPDWIRLPPRWWGVIARVCWWLLNQHQGQETRSEAQARARAAADRLAERSARGERVLVIAHGYFNLMIGSVLERRGWRRTLDQGFRYWCARRFEPPVVGEGSRGLAGRAAPAPNDGEGARTPLKTPQF